MGYTSIYPTQDADHVKATTEIDGGSGAPYQATDPAKSLTGPRAYQDWICLYGEDTEQRFHIDLGSGKIIKRIYYENYHSSGGSTNAGIENFTFWGSNTEASFLELTYGIDTGWTELTVAQNTMDEHIGEDIADPKYIVVTNSTPYRYYAFKIADGWGYVGYTGVRRIELQIEVVALISTAVITSSITGSLSRGVTEALTSTSAITSSITGRLTRIIDLVSTSTIATSITSILSRGITGTLNSTSTITTSISSALSRGIKENLVSTANIAISITSSLSRGITQSLNSTVNIVSSIIATLTAVYTWIRVTKEVGDFTKVEKEKDDWTKVNREKEDWDKEDKE